MISKAYNVPRINGLKMAFPELSPREVMEKHFVPLPQYTSTGNLDDLAEIGYQITEKILDQDPGVQALFYHSDYFVLGGIQCLCDHGIMPGKDILLAGVNNIHAIRNNVFPVSSISHDIREKVRTIMEYIDTEEPFTVTSVPEPVIRT